MKLESSLVSGVAEGSSHRIGRLEDGLCPTKPDISKHNICIDGDIFYLHCTSKDGR